MYDVTWHVQCQLSKIANKIQKPTQQQQQY